jgi:hypothetical protein
MFGPLQNVIISSTMFINLFEDKIMSRYGALSSHIVLMKGVIESMVELEGNFFGVTEYWQIKNNEHKFDFVIDILILEF